MSTLPIVTHSRRSFLRLSSGCLALPILESLGGSSLAAKPAAKKMVFLGLGNGFTNETFYPIKEGAFTDIGLTEGLGPIKAHQDDITMLANVTNLGATDPHGGSTSFLTGANVAGTVGKTFFNSISCDQVAAHYLGKDTRFPSLTLAAKTESGHGKGLSLAWSADGTPIPGIINPYDLFASLFVDNKESKEERELREQTNRSILDAQKLNGSMIKNNLSKLDGSKLEEYFESIRQIEREFERQKKWSTTPKPKAPFAAPEKNITGIAEVKLMYDMIALALQSDSTRVVTYRQPIRSVLVDMGITLDAHSITHYGASNLRKEASRQREQKSIELFSYFLTKLKSLTDSDGSRLYDNCIVSWGTNLRSTHELRNLPLIIAGKGANKLRHGRHIILPKKDTPLGNVWLTLLHQAGVPVDNFSHSTGIVKEMLV